MSQEAEVIEEVETSAEGSGLGLKDFTARYGNKAPKKAKINVFDAVDEENGGFSFGGGNNTELENEEPEPETEVPNGSNLYGEPSRAAMLQGKMVSRMVDAGVSNALKGISNTSSRSQWKADPEDMEELEYLWAIYLEESGNNIPPWLMLLLFSMMTYGPKTVQAVNIRKVNKRGVNIPKEPTGDYTKPEKAQEPANDEPIEVEVEEIPSENLNERLNYTNSQAAIHNLTPFANYARREGYCQWEWYINGREVQLAKGRKFSQQIYSTDFMNLKKQYKKAGIEWPPDFELNP